MAFGTPKIESVEQIEDKNPDLYVRRAEDRLKQGDLQGALAESDKAIAYSGGKFHYTFQKMKILHFSGSYVECVEYIDSLLLHSAKSNADRIQKSELYMYRNSSLLKKPNSIQIKYLQEFNDGYFLGNQEGTSRDGLGVFLSTEAKKISYAGEWKKDFMEGEGTLGFGDKERITGKWRKNRLVAIHRIGVEPDKAFPVTQGIGMTFGEWKTFMELAEKELAELIQEGKKDRILQKSMQLAELIQRHPALSMALEFSTKSSGTKRTYLLLDLLVCWLAFANVQTSLSSFPPVKQRFHLVREMMDHYRLEKREPFYKYLRKRSFKSWRKDYLKQHKWAYLLHPIVVSALFAGLIFGTNLISIRIEQKLWPSFADRAAIENFNNEWLLEEFLRKALIAGNDSRVEYLLKHGANPNGTYSNGMGYLDSAVRSHNITIVRLLLDAGTDPNAASYPGSTVLGRAARDGDTVLMELLMKHGASSVETFLAEVGAKHLAQVEMFLRYHVDVNAMTKGYVGKTALQIAIESGSKEMVELLLASKADPNLTGGVEVPLVTAIRNKNAQLAKILLDAGASVTVLDHSGSSPLHYAVSGEMTETVKELIAVDADVNAKDAKGKTPLHLAVTSGNMELVMLLLQSKADVNIADNNGTTALHLTASRNDLPMMKLLVAKGAQINVVNLAEQQPLLIALNEGNVELAAYLVAQGARINDYGRADPPLYTAIRKGKTELIQFLLNKGAHANRIALDGSTTLLALVETSGDVEFAKQLLQKGADPNVANEEGNSALSVAIANNNRVLVQLFTPYKQRIKLGGELIKAMIGKDWAKANRLIKSGAEVNLIGSDANIADKSDRLYQNYTPLMLAIYFSREEMVETLLSEGADPNLPSTGLDNALQLALFRAAQDQMDVVQKLLSKGADLNMKEPNTGETYLHLAIEDENYGMFHYLLDHGADPNIRANNGETPLFYAVRVGSSYLYSEGMTDELLAKGADPTIVNKDGQTAMDVLKTLGYIPASIYNALEHAK